MRKIVQIAAIDWAEGGDYHSPQVFALCNDGSLWEHDIPAREWHRLPDIPQEAVEGGAE
jgi:hypothetical protein